MKQIGRLDLLFLLCLIGVLTVAGLWRKPDPSPVASATPPVQGTTPTLTPGMFITATPTVQGTPLTPGVIITATPVVMGTPLGTQTSTILIADPPKNQARPHYTAPKRKPGEDQEGGNSPYTY